MTTRNPGSPGNGSSRRTRPALERTGPRRSIVNAFYQPDQAAAPRMNGSKFEDDHVWGKGNAGTSDPEAEQAQQSTDTPARPGGLWSDPFEAVRAAYGVVNEQIQAGYEEAGRLSTDGEQPRGRKLTQILNRLIQTYTDLGSQWIDLVLATAEDREKQAAPTSAAPAPADEMSLAVELTTARPAKARALLYRPVSGTLRAWPLRREGGNGEIASISVAPGPVLAVEIGAETQPGLYREIVIEENVEEPAGSVIVTVLDRSDD